MKSDKFTSRTHKCVFVDYEPSSWILWDDNKLIHSKDIIFDESLFYTNETHGVIDNNLLNKSED